MRDATDGKVSKEVSVALKYDHPPWLHKCAVIYLDVGSNIGVQIRKLFEPERYPGAPVLDLFDNIFGAPADRRLPATSNGLCALGLEPNPQHRGRLQTLQANYTSKGWNVHFYPYAAWKDEGSMIFDEATQPSTEDWAAKLEPMAIGKDPKRPQVSVRTVSLADFVTSLPPHSVKLMKVDIEGAEYETIWRMLQQRTLCKGTVDKAFFESHQWGDVTDWKDDRTFQALVTHIAAADCGLGGVATEVTSLDDETFVLDEPEEELKQMRKAKQKHIMCAVALAGTLFGFWMGFHSYKLQQADPLGAKLTWP